MRLLAPVVIALLLLAVPHGQSVVPQDDAGSGRDAPDTPLDVIRIQAGVVYEGMLTGQQTDAADYYAFEAAAGQTIEARAWSHSICLGIHRPDGQVVQQRCTIPSTSARLEHVADEAGIWFVALRNPAPQTYEFSLGLDAAAPVPGPSAVTGVLASGQPAIQPGELVTTPAGACTLNFVYDGIGALAGKVYIGTAAHCFTDVGHRASTTAYPNFGTVVYMGDLGKSLNGTPYQNDCNGTQLDFALIEVKPEFHGAVSAEVKGHPGLPHGGVFPRSNVALGDRLDFSGYGLGFGATQLTREERFGFWYSSSGDNWVAIGPIISGDSGGPALHQDGRAFGVATHIGSEIGGPYLERAIQDATGCGFPVTLRSAS